jgi:phosphoglycerate dehydrogenase-like enzyme
MALQLLLSRPAAKRFGAGIHATLAQHAHRIVHPDEFGEDDSPPIDIALLSRDVTGKSTKFWHTEEMTRFARLVDRSPCLRWVHIHSAGTDRPIYPPLIARGVCVTTSSGANAATVAASAVGGIIALARRFPALADAQRRHAWEPFQEDDAPRDIAGQSALIVGLGPIGREIARLLRALGMRVTGARQRSGAIAECDETITYEGIDERLPQADWLVLACPLSPLTRARFDARALARMPRGAHLVNVSRGEVVVETDMVAALACGTLAGAWLDVFDREPLDAASPLWDMRNVIISPHTSSRSEGNYDRVGRLFLDNLARWRDGATLANMVSSQSA